MGSLCDAQKLCPVFLEHSNSIELNRLSKSNLLSEFLGSVATNHFPANNTRMLSHHATQRAPKINLCSKWYERHNSKPSRRLAIGVCVVPGTLGNTKITFRLYFVCTTHSMRSPLYVCKCVRPTYLLAIVYVFVVHVFVCFCCRLRISFVHRDDDDEIRNHPSFAFYFPKIVIWCVCCSWMPM